MFDQNLVQQFLLRESALVRKLFISRGRKHDLERFARLEPNSVS
jgi:hypothetical protein